MPGGGTVKNNRDVLPMTLLAAREYVSSLLRNPSKTDELELERKIPQNSLKKIVNVIFFKNPFLINFFGARARDTLYQILEKNWTRVTFTNLQHAIFRDDVLRQILQEFLVRNPFLMNGRYFMDDLVYVGRPNLHENDTLMPENVATKPRNETLYDRARRLIFIDFSQNPELLESITTNYNKASGSHYSLNDMANLLETNYPHVVRDQEQWASKVAFWMYQLSDQAHANSNHLHVLSYLNYCKGRGFIPKGQSLIVTAVDICKKDFQKWFPILSWILENFDREDDIFPRRYDVAFTYAVENLQMDVAEELYRRASKPKLYHFWENPRKPLTLPIVVNLLLKLGFEYDTIQVWDKSTGEEIPLILFCLSQQYTGREFDLGNFDDAMRYDTHCNVIQALAETTDWDPFAPSLVVDSTSPTGVKSSTTVTPYDFLKEHNSGSPLIPYFDASRPQRRRREESPQKLEKKQKNRTEGEYSAQSCGVY